VNEKETAKIQTILDGIPAERQAAEEKGEAGMWYLKLTSHQIAECKRNPQLFVVRIVTHAPSCSVGVFWTRQAHQRFHQSTHQGTENVFAHNCRFFRHLRAAGAECAVPPLAAHLPAHLRCLLVSTLLRTHYKLYLDNLALSPVCHAPRFVPHLSTCHPHVAFWHSFATKPT
jgi:hypothetical protein